MADVGAGYRMTTRDRVAGLILGVVCTALAYLMWTYGIGMIKVQHSSILGYLEPVSAPIYALLLLGRASGAGRSPAGPDGRCRPVVALLGEHEEEAPRPWAGAVSGEASGGGGRRLRGYPWSATRPSCSAPPASGSA